MKHLITEIVNYTTNLPTGYRQLTIPGISVQHLKDEETGYICKAVALKDWGKIKAEIDAHYPGFLETHGYTL
jgi:hypothetical protein